MAEDDKTDSLLDDAKKDTGNLETLVEVMRENNASTSNIEADQRNTRRHLLEMKKPVCVYRLDWCGARHRLVRHG